MPAFPIPVFASVALLWVLLRALIRRDGPPIFLALLGLCAVQALLTAMALHYALTPAEVLRPITAAAIPPLAWTAFVSTALRGLEPRDAVHLVAPAFVGFCRIDAPAALDLVIPALFLAYGGMILWVLHHRAGDLPRLGLGAGDAPMRLWRWIAWALIGSALSDVVIVAAQIAERGDLVPWIVSIASSLTLVLVGGIALTPDLNPESPTSPEPEPETLAAEADLMARLEELMRRDRLYLDPDLTLNRLSRRLHVPAKRLSEAINRQTGGNVARLVNGHRVRAACDALAGGQSVTEAMLSAGFATKSNFNRAFQLATGQNPSQWRVLQAGQSGATLTP